MRTIIILLFLALPAFPQMLQGIVGGKPPVAAAGCSTSKFSCTPTSQGPTAVAQNDASYYKGDTVTLASGDVICSVTMRLTKSAGSITGKTFKVFIYSLSSNNLGTLLGTSDGVTGSDSWSATDVAFSFSTPASISSNADYAIVLGYSGVGGVDWDGTNYASINYGSNCAGGHLSGWNQYTGTRTDDWTSLSAIMSVTKQ